MSNHDNALKQQLLFALEKKGARYQPRTRYLDENKRPRYINRLILEDSPYLLQHAHNPVDWFPWSDAAFSKAKKENKPIFLSIGYATCHWCHVMEEESFDNEMIAKQLNEYFICIKVDRELHLDVDAFYMTAVMMMQGHGGWPMSSFLTMDKKPFFGGTYYQPTQFIALINRVNALWHKQRNQLLEQSDAITRQITNIMASTPSHNPINKDIIELTAQTIMDHYDPHFGGFGAAPKFPNEPYLYFLLDYAIYSERTDVLDAVVKTLHIQSCSGLYDQIAGGFHRYATDRDWLIPHFEKMLYNQANLSYVFTQAYLLTGAKDFKRIACETLDYIVREITAPDGGFYSATDADSNGEEGLFFVWDQQEISALLEKDADKFIQLYQITNEGNFNGKNILHLNQPLEVHASQNYIDYDELIKRLKRHKRILWNARGKRTPPLRDDKVITAWNGMMIKSFAYAGQQLNRQDYIDVAIKAARYILKKNQTETGSLSRASLEGHGSIPALQEDYAYLAEALLQIYDVTLDKQWLKQSKKLLDQMIEKFWDDKNGGFFMAAQSGTGLLPSAPKEINDNATASGNSVALKTLVRLNKRGSAAHYQKYAQQLIQTYAEDIRQRSAACSYLISGLLDMYAGEQAASQWCADGNIHIKSKIDANNKVTLHIRIDEPWHLTPVKDQVGNTVPVSIDAINGWGISNKTYPEPISKTLRFQTKSVNVYAMRLHITFNVSNKKHDLLPDFPGNLIKLKLGLQACNNEKCLAPETINLILIKQKSN